MTQARSLRKHPLTLRRGRALRRRLTPAEAKLWQRLRGRGPGFKFRRQHPVGPYILDFFCSQTKLAVEVNGDLHAEPDQVRHDRERTAWLRLHEIEVMRLPAAEVERSIEDVLRGIWEECEKRRGGA